MFPIPPLLLGIQGIFGTSRTMALHLLVDFFLHRLEIQEENATLTGLGLKWRLGRLLYYEEVIIQVLPPNLRENK
jgi:hypothetical protein